jgi:thermostable 8-oxoguanine DNA glycosylase
MKIASDLAWNFAKLEEDSWPALLEKCNSLLLPSEPSAEREVADFLASRLRGIGPKQARNILQDLGLTRFEIPVDSRVMRWLNDCKVFPFTVTARALSDWNYYHFILDAIQELCRNCGTYPCILDASIFSSLENRQHASH